MKLGVVLLASGSSTRFGENKLLADFDGRPMVCCAMGAAMAAEPARAAVVTGYDSIAQLAKMHGYEVIVNDAPQKGQAHSIVLGVRAMADMDAVLLVVCDQPLLSCVSVKKLIVQFCGSDKGMACLCDETHRGNPAVFSSAHYNELLALAGDCGAKAILRQHEEDLLVVACVNPNELADVDTPQMLADMNL